MPVGTWTEDFKEHLESLTETTDKTGKKIIPLVKDYDDMCKDTHVDFLITLQKGKLEELEAMKADNGCNGIHKTFKLYSTMSTSNMHLFDEREKLQKYDTVKEIIDDYFDTRLDLYQTRKEYLIDVYEKEFLIFLNKTKYLRELLNDTIDLRRKTNQQVIQMLEEKNYHKPEGDDDYKYLLKMQMDSVTQENIDALSKQLMGKQQELKDIKNTTIEQMWKNELTQLEDEYKKYSDQRRALMNPQTSTKKLSKKIKVE